MSEVSQANDIVSEGAQNALEGIFKQIDADKDTLSDKESQWLKKTLSKLETKNPALIPVLEERLKVNKELQNLKAEILTSVPLNEKGKIKKLANKPKRFYETLIRELQEESLPDNSLDEHKNQQNSAENVETPVAQMKASDLLKQSFENLQSTFLVENGDGTFTVDFKGNYAAKARLGAGDLFPKADFLVIDGVVGKLSVTLSGKVGFKDASGKYLPIFGGEKISPQATEEQKQSLAGIAGIPAGKTVEDLQTSFQKKIEFSEKAATLSESEIDNGENLKGQALLDDPEFSQKLNRVCSHLGVNRTDMELVMRKESGINPKALNPTGGATGLIQFMPKTAWGLGTTTGELRSMSGVDQLDYVKKYFEPYAKRLKNAGDLYMVTFYPYALNKSDNFIVGSEKSDGWARKVAQQNPGIANYSDKEGYITKSAFKKYVYT